MHLGTTMVVFALVGLYGYVSSGGITLGIVDVHSLHALMGMASLVLSLAAYGTAFHGRSRASRVHCRIGNVAAGSSALSLLMGFLLLSGLFNVAPSIAVVQVASSSVLPEVEVEEFLGLQLTSLSEQRNNAILGTQYVDRASYRLSVTGLVEQELSMTYEELLRLPAYSTVAYMPCVEGWGFTAKWTGFRVIDLLNRSGVRPEATFVVFYSRDNYSTGLPLDYLLERKTLMAYGINDLTLPPDRGFPFQLVAEGKYGYKWAKWITRIEVVLGEYEGFWESRGYSNTANVGEYPFG